jgi:hypothetical protein
MGSDDRHRIKEKNIDPIGNHLRRFGSHRVKCPHAEACDFEDGESIEEHKQFLDDIGRDACSMPRGIARENSIQ